MEQHSLAESGRCLVVGNLQPPRQPGGATKQWQRSETLRLFPHQPVRSAATPAQYMLRPVTYDAVSYLSLCWPPTRKLPRRQVVIASAIVAVSLTLLPSSVTADHGTDAAKQAAADIQAARNQANAASQAMFDAESDIDGLDVDIAAAEVELTELETQAAEMRLGLEAQAVRSFVGAGTGSEFPLLIDFDEINNGLTADVMAAVTRETANVDLDEYDELMDDVSHARDQLAEDRGESEQARLDFADLKTNAEAEIEALAEVEAERLVSEEVEHELERQREREAAAEAARVAQEAAQAAQQAANAIAAAPAAAAAPAPSGASAQPDAT